MCAVNVGELTLLVKVRQIPDLKNPEHSPSAVGVNNASVWVVVEAACSLLVESAADMAQGLTTIQQSVRLLALHIFGVLTSKSTPSMLRLRSGVCEINAHIAVSADSVRPRAPHLNVAEVRPEGG